MHTIDTATGYLIGLDLGERNDYTAVSVLRQHAVPTGRMLPYRGIRSFPQAAPPRPVPEMEYHYDCLYFDRWRGRGYRDVVPALERLDALLEASTRQERRSAGLANQPDLPSWLVVDYTGVGLAVVNDIIRANGVKATGVIITAGNAVTHHGRDYGVPKRELVSHLQVVLQSRRLTMPSEADFPLTGVLVRELDNFKAKANLATGHDTFGAAEPWREGNHDDLVLSVAMAMWYGEHVDPAKRHNRKLVGV